MSIHLSPDQEAFVRLGIKSSRYENAEDAIRQALSLWEERERSRTEILVSVDKAEASLAQGDGRIIAQESMQKLAKDVNRRGRKCLASERQRRG